MSTVINVENLSKRYRLGLKESRKDTLLGQILQNLRSPLDNFKRLRSMTRFDEEDESVFWALRDINFEVKKGEVLGIIGHNGAGKSTLLKILSRITEPTKGRITIKGRIAALLEVGTGFHQDLTGRENIYMNGTILGMTRKEIDRKMDEIVDFGGVEKHLDTPVKFYSSGMKVRLGFAVAAHLEPDILIIDEVLAVGDAEFQKKCLGKMEEVANLGRTVLFVSHDLRAIQKLCSKAILLNQGKLEYYSTTHKVIGKYLSSIYKNEDLKKNGDLFSIYIVSEFQDNFILKSIKYNHSFDLNLIIENNFEEIDYSLGFDVKNELGEIVVHIRSDNNGPIKLNFGKNSLSLNIKAIPFVSGVYNFNLWIAEYKGKRLEQFCPAFKIKVIPIDDFLDLQSRGKKVTTILESNFTVN